MVTIFSDFDGVLYDTLKESYALCRKVLYNIEVNKYIEKNKFDKFTRYKFLVFNVWQYLYLMKVLSDKHIKTDDEFIRNYCYLLKTRDFAEEKEFDKNFTEAKRKLIEENNVLLLEKLETKFPFFDMIFNLKDKIEIVIVSKSNNFDIKSKLNKNGITDVKIIGKENLTSFRNKGEFIADYINKNNIDKAFFIDDNTYNLKSCLNIPNLECILAGWGNIAIGEKGKNAEEVIKLIEENI